MVSLFQLADPGENRGNAVTVKEVLDKGAQATDIFIEAAEHGAVMKLADGIPEAAQAMPGPE